MSEAKIYLAGAAATAASSIAASFGLSVLIWQDVVGLPVYWVVALMAVIILLTVGSDYNLLLVSRFKEEIHAGLKTDETDNCVNYPPDDAAVWDWSPGR